MAAVREQLVELETTGFGGASSLGGGKAGLQIKQEGQKALEKAEALGAFACSGQELQRAP